MIEEEIAHCECGEPLVGRQKVWCTECIIKNHPASSQCPYCMTWYYTHSASLGTRSEMDHHAKKQCL